MIRRPSILLLALWLCGCTEPAAYPVDYVDPFVGTGSHGHTYPGASAPFGMVQLSPDTRANNWDACSGYHYSDTTIDGFSHTHLSGTGCADLGDVMFYPSLRSDLVEDDCFVHRPYGFSHSDETASCGYYRVALPDEGITVELTATPRTGVHRYIFAGDGPRSVVIDLMHTISDEKVDLADITCTGHTTVEGMRRTQGWVTDHYVFFSAEFSHPAASVKLLGNRQAVLTFEPEVDTLTVAVGISSVSTENARLNRLTETPETDFDLARSRTVEQWRSALGRIEVSGGSKRQLVNFYTSLYHSMLTPNLTSDVNGQYRRNDNTIATLPEGECRYSTFSLWDTFRAWHPLQTILDTHFVGEMIASLLDMYDCTGELPLWPLASGETNTMIGYHSVSVIADAWLKGIRSFDGDKALDAMIRSSNINANGSDYYTADGFIPSNIKRQSVSCTLEYAYDDWTIYRMAESLGRSDAAAAYAARALNYVNVFDGSTRFFRGRRSDGGWTTPFAEFSAGRDYTEATPWQYRFFVPHDVNGLVQLFGGREAFIEELDRLFTVEAPAEEMELISDITGLKGQYAHGNEPSHHMAYLYNWVGEAWKTQKLTRELLDEMYAPEPDGIIGNEDCGQMSAWYIFTSLGLYPVCPGSGEFALTAPLFERADIRLANGRTLAVTADNPARNIYIKSVTLNGRAIERNFVTYDELMEGGELHFELSRRPDTVRGSEDWALPYSLTHGEVVSVPYTEQNLSLFTEPVDVELGVATEGAEIRYTIDGSEPDGHSALYESPVRIDRSLTLRAKGFKEGMAPGCTMTVEAEKAEFMKPSAAARGASGVRYNYYRGVFSHTSQIVSGEPADSGVMTEPSIADAPDEDHFGYVFSGMIHIPERGVWEFMTLSDDGSVLFIGDRKVVDNDSSHAAVSATGRIALEEGWYPFRLLYFEDYEGQELSWGWRLSPSDRFARIPAGNLRTE